MYHGNNSNTLERLRGFKYSPSMLQGFIIFYKQGQQVAQRKTANDKQQ